MNFADFAFEYHHTHELLSSCCRFQRTTLSAFWFIGYGFWRPFITSKRLLRKLNAQVLKPGSQCVRESLYVQPLECSSDMQATERRQIVQPNNRTPARLEACLERWLGQGLEQGDDRAEQPCPALSLKQGCAVQQWVVQLPSFLESGT